MRELLLAAAVLASADAPLELRSRQGPLRPEERVPATALEAGQGLPLAPGALLGCVVLAEEWRDARGHRVAPGRYRLRYALQPRLKDHLGADSSRDFALLVPDGVPEDADLLASARHAAGSPHPAVMELRAAPSDAAGAIQLDDGRRAFVAPIDGVAVAFVVEPRRAAASDAF